MFAFDGTNKTITLDLGTVTLSVRDVYSRWVDWFISVNGNQKYLPAFLTVGGDTIDATAGTKIPIYAFLINGWRIKPQEADHTLQVNDGILLVDGGGDPFTISFDSGGSGVSYTLEQIADAVWTRTQRELTAASTSSLTEEQNQKLMNTLTVGNFIALKG